MLTSDMVSDNALIGKLNGWADTRSNAEEEAGTENASARA